MNALTDALTAPSWNNLSPRTRRILARGALVLLIALPCIALATPPSWAPAHGWRKKNDPSYAGYSGRQWEKDYGVTSGRCDRSAIGAEIGRRMDKTDRSCVGHALELGTSGQAVAWSNPNTGVSYKLTPTGEPALDGGCRKFRLVATGSFGLSEGRAVACPGEDGTWDLAPDARLGRR